MITHNAYFNGNVQSLALQGHEKPATVLIFMNFILRIQENAPFHSNKIAKFFGGGPPTPGS